jgi:hypothetical protein
VQRPSLPARAFSGPGIVLAGGYHRRWERWEMTMKLTSELPPADRERVEGRLRSNLIA